MDANTITLITHAMKQAEPPLFECGVIAVAGGLQAWAQANLPTELLENENWVHILLYAHSRGRWENMPPSDAALNQRALQTDARIFSAFSFFKTRIYVITEEERDVTTLMRSDEY